MEIMAAATANCCLVARFVSTLMSCTPSAIRPATAPRPVAPNLITAAFS
jgi:hypothetical protein